MEDSPLEQQLLSLQSRLEAAQPELDRDQMLAANARTTLSAARQMLRLQDNLVTVMGEMMDLLHDLEQRDSPEAHNQMLLLRKMLNRDFEQAAAWRAQVEKLTGYGQQVAEQLGV